MKQTEVNKVASMYKIKYSILSYAFNHPNYLINYYSELLMQYIHR
jgi:hypothetical protein